MTRTILRTALFLLILPVGPNSASAQLSTPALLDTIQHAAFNFFWQEANPANGLIKDRSTPGSVASIASVGFGLSAICIGVDHGWVTRDAAKDRVLRTLKTFWTGPQGSGDGSIGYYGLFYHWLDMATATRTWNSELSTIDTGLLLAGIIDAKQYFDGTDSTEQEIRVLADSLYYRMNWDFMRNAQPGIMMGYQPVGGFSSFGEWIGYNEASIMYILALGSPTYSVPASAWNRWWSGYRWRSHYGYSFVEFPPLFGHQYSHCWIDFRNIQDAYMRLARIDYFENSRRATLAQRRYCIINPGGHTGYSDSLWGITASDVPGGYSARGAPPAENDDGTITPTAPISSIAFAPDSVLPVIHNMWNNYRPQLWMQYGFRDAFNLNVGWYDTDVIGIDQGPIIIMIENYLNERVWKRFMKNADIQRGLQVAGFQAVTSVDQESVPAAFALEQNYPNPFNPTTTIVYRLTQAAHVILTVYDILGREVAVVVNQERQAGTHRALFDASGRAGGIYVYRLTAGRSSAARTMIMVK